MCLLSALSLSVYIQLRLSAGLPSFFFFFVCVCANQTHSLGGKVHVERGGERAAQNHEMSPLTWEVLTFCPSWRQGEEDSERRMLGWDQTRGQRCSSLSCTMGPLHSEGGHYHGGIIEGLGIFFDAASEDYAGSALILTRFCLFQVDGRFYRQIYDDIHGSYAL